jgi:heme-degrading monooxygenase HmoA
LFVAMHTYELGAGSVDDFMRRLDGLSNRLSREPGFRTHHVIASGSDTVVSVTLFDDALGSRQAEQITAEHVTERLQQFQINLVASIAGEIGVARLAAVEPCRRTPEGTIS